jgi:hypothetical protein
MASAGRVSGMALGVCIGSTPLLGQSVAGAGRSRRISRLVGLGLAESECVLAWRGDKDAGAGRRLKARPGEEAPQHCAPSKLGRTFDNASCKEHYLAEPLLA